MHRSDHGAPDAALEGMNLAQHAMQLAEILRGEHFITALLERANPDFHRRLVDTTTS